MCVILVCEDMAPTEEILEACEEENPQGCGMAWREKGMVLWQKGVKMTTSDVLRIMKRVTLPYVIHYRIASQGSVCDELCHPFPYGAKDNRLTGATKNGVIFHNGTMHSWKRDMKEAAIYSNTPIPPGRWSDSKAMAFLAGIYGTGYMEFLEEKIVAFTPEQGPQIFGTTNQGWTFKKLDGDKGIWFSNDRWEKKLDRSTTSSGACTERSGPVVGSFAHVNDHRARGHYRGGTAVETVRAQTRAESGPAQRSSDPRFPCSPWRKPLDCHHDAGTYSYFNAMRFCTECGSRLDPVKNEPWISTDTGTQDDTTTAVPAIVEAALLLQAAKGQGAESGPRESIAKRVKRLVLATAIREGHAV